MMSAETGPAGSSSSTPSTASHYEHHVALSSSPGTSTVPVEYPPAREPSSAVVVATPSSRMDFMEPSPLMMSQRPPTRDPRCQRRRVEFALLIKILLKLLLDQRETTLYHQVRLSISTCTNRNRMGDPSFMPLEDVLEAHLWLMVGDTYWDRAVNLQQRYLQRKAFQPQHKQTSRQHQQTLQDKQSRRVVPL